MLALPLGGCAKFPKGGISGGFTRIHFVITYGGPVNPSYIYYVAIRRMIGTDVTSGATEGPVPVYGVGSTNGFVEGLPTHAVQYDPSSPESYYVYPFLGTTPTQSANQTDPGRLASPSPVLSGIDPTQLTSTPGTNQLVFDITTQDLARNSDGSTIDPKTITGFQFNILSMNKLLIASGDASGRIMDALGNQSSSTSASEAFNRYVSLQTAHSVKNSDGVNLYPETSGDETNPGVGNIPAIDLIDYEIDVYPVQT